MSHFIRKFLHSNFNRSLLVQHFYSQPQTPNPNSVTINYMMHQFGFSLDKAKSASKHINFETPNPNQNSRLNFIKFNRCVTFLQTHGFTNTHLHKFLTTCPKLITSDPQTALLPTIQFFNSKGFSRPEIPTLIMVEPQVFNRSVDNDLIPSFNLLKDRLGSVEDAVKCIRKCPTVLVHFKSRVRTNIKFLKEGRVSNKDILFGLSNEPGRFVLAPDKFRELVEEVWGMGIHPRSWRFIGAVCSKGSVGKLAWERKLEVYKVWGCTEVEVLRAFKRVPRIMKVSKEKIDGVMDYFVNEMGWAPQMVMETPKLFTYSLGKRIVPRCSVYKLLVSKGLVKVEGSLYTVVTYPEDKFLKMFIKCYRKEAPELLRHYNEKMNSSNEQI